MNDPQYEALQTFVTVDDENLGPVKMQNVPFRLSRTPGRIRWTGREKGQDNEEIYGKWLKLTQAEMKLLSDHGVI
jgi:crotonobetainyl-CoA:carnitine CoA-transferase CaiB-like acyl-CoA transferase